MRKLRTRLLNLLTYGLLAVAPLFWWACVERFSLNVPRESQNYIVEAILLDDVRHQKVVVSKINLDGETERVVGSEVRLERRDGEVLFFEGSESGEYLLPDFQPLETGQEYRLVIQNPDESVITSDWETVPAGVDIDSGYWEYEVTSFINDNGVEINKIGFNFGINTGVFQEDNTYLRYDYQTTHINYAPFRDPRCDCINCYVTLQPKNFLKIASATKARGKSLQNETVEYLLLDKKFSYRLTMLIKQFSITANAYMFYEALDQQRSLEGGIFDPPPAIIKGNLHYEGLGETNVYGVFELGRYDETIVTIFKGNIENEFLTYEDLCYAGLRTGDVPAVCFSCYNEEGVGPRPYYFE